MAAKHKDRIVRWTGTMPLRVGPLGQEVENDGDHNRHIRKAGEVYDFPPHDRTPHDEQEVRVKGEHWEEFMKQPGIDAMVRPNNMGGQLIVRPA